MVFIIWSPFMIKLLNSVTARDTGSKEPELDLGVFEEFDSPVVTEGEVVGLEDPGKVRYHAVQLSSGFLLVTK